MGFLMGRLMLLEGERYLIYGTKTRFLDQSAALEASLRNRQ
jgi:hypothetical protein